MPNEEKYQPLPTQTTWADIKTVAIVALKSWIIPPIEKWENLVQRATEGRENGKYCILDQGEKIYVSPSPEPPSRALRAGGRRWAWIRIHNGKTHILEQGGRKPC